MWSQHGRASIELAVSTPPSIVDLAHSRSDAASVPPTGKRPTSSGDRDDVPMAARIAARVRRTPRLADEGASLEFLKVQLEFRAGSDIDRLAPFQTNSIGSFAHFKSEMTSSAGPGLFPRRKMPQMSQGP